MDEVFTQLGKLYGLPGYALVTVFCIVIAVCLKRWKKFPNDGVLLAVVLTGAVFNSVIADPVSDSLTFRVWLVKNVVFGAICGFAGFVVHGRLPNKLLGINGDTTFTKKVPPAP